MWRGRRPLALARHSMQKALKTSGLEKSLPPNTLVAPQGKGSAQRWKGRDRVCMRSPPVLTLEAWPRTLTGKVLSPAASSKDESSSTKKRQLGGHYSAAHLEVIAKKLRVMLPTLSLQETDAALGHLREDCPFACPDEEYEISIAMINTAITIAGVEKPGSISRTEHQAVWLLG